MDNVDLSQYIKCAFYLFLKVQYILLHSSLCSFMCWVKNMLEQIVLVN